MLSIHARRSRRFATPSHDGSFAMPKPAPATSSKTVFAFSSRVSKEKLAALGRMCVHFSLLEMKIEQCIWGLRGLTRKTGRLETRRQPFVERCKAMRKASQSRFAVGSNHRKFFKDVCKIALDLAKDRNLFVHGLWAYNTTKGKRRQLAAISYFVKLEGAGQEVTAAALDGLTKNIVELAGLIDKRAPAFLGTPLP